MRANRVRANAARTLGAILNADSRDEAEAILAAALRRTWEAGYWSGWNVASNYAIDAGDGTHTPNPYDGKG